MSARFVVVHSMRHFFIGLLGLGLALVGSCSVFPDQATLPARPPAAGSGGNSTARGGAGGGNVASPGGDGVGATAEGGALSMGGARAPAGAGGELMAAGAGGVPPTICVNLEQQVAVTTADTWIDAAKQGIGHGNESTLSVVAGSAERRALIEFPLPAVPPGKVLNRAALALHLETDADVGLAARHLGLHQLTQAVSESRATWLNYDNGGGAKWDKAGGDFGMELSTAALPAGTSSGTVTFEVTDAVRQLLRAVPIPLSLIMLEQGPPPPGRAELAFTSREGDASGIPALILDFCDQ